MKINLPKDCQMFVYFTDALPKTKSYIYEILKITSDDVRSAYHGNIDGLLQFSNPEYFWVAYQTVKTMVPKYQRYMTFFTITNTDNDEVNIQEVVD